MKNELKIFLASPRGFCAGVDRAIEIVKKALNKYGPPVYVRHEIVHNKNVVESLKKLGAIFVEVISEISDISRPVIFSAHGVPKKVPKEARLKKIFYVDATCPLVSKVHRETEQLYDKGFDIDKGAILINEDQILHGAQAINFICSKIKEPSDSLLNIPLSPDLES